MASSLAASIKAWIEKARFFQTGVVATQKLGRHFARKINHGTRDTVSQPENKSADTVVQVERIMENLCDTGSSCQKIASTLSATQRSWSLASSRPSTLSNVR